MKINRISRPPPDEHSDSTFEAAHEVNNTELHLNHLTIEQFLLLSAISLSRNRDSVKNLLDLIQVPIRELRRLGVLKDAGLLGTARDGDPTVLDDPTNSHLRRGHALGFGDFGNSFNKLDVLIKVFGLEAWKHASEVILRQIVRLANLAAQEAAANRAVRHDGNANFERRSTLLVSIQRSALFLRRLLTLMASV